MLFQLETSDTWQLAYGVSMQAWLWHIPHGSDIICPETGRTLLLVLTIVSRADELTVMLCSCVTQIHLSCRQEHVCMTVWNRVPWHCMQDCFPPRNARQSAPHFCLPQTREDYYKSAILSLRFRLSGPAACSIQAHTAKSLQ